MGKVRQQLSNTGAFPRDGYELSDDNMWGQGEDAAGGGQGKRHLGLCCSRVF